MKTKIIFTLSCLMLLACTAKQKSIEAIVDAYYLTYDKREDLDHFMEFYDEDVILEDIINGDKVSGKSSLKNFLNWDNAHIEFPENHSLVVKEKIISNNKAVISGYFTTFQWGENTFEPMHFTTILTFNDSNKIIKQVDWINYPSELVDYANRKNSNEWIN